MWLINFPKVRAKKYPRGWVVEIQKKRWYGKKYWTHIISTSGIESDPWFFNTFETAVTEAKKCFEWDLIIETKNTEKNYQSIEKITNLD